MYKKSHGLKMLKLISFVLIALAVSFAFTYNVDAAVKLDKKYYYKISGTGISGKYTIAKFHTTKGMGFCYQISKVGAVPVKNLSFVKTIKSGPVLYVLDKGGTSTNKEYTYTQFALWKVLGTDNTRPSKVGSSSPYLKEAKKRAQTAKKNKSYKVNPSISATASSPVISNGNYQSTVKVSLTDASSYTVSLSGAPTGTQIINASTGKVDSTMSKGQNFYIRIPVSKLTATKTVKATVKATGKYKYVNVYSPPSNRQDIAVLISENKTVSDSVSVKFAPKTIKVYKVDYDNDKTYLAGAKYKIYKGEGCTTEVPGFTAEKTTNSSGVVEWDGLEAGTYSVKETAAPGGYGAPTTQCQTVKVGGAVTFKNKKNTITVYKVNKATGAKLAGAVFALYTNSTCTTPAKAAISPGGNFTNIVSDSNGKAIFTGMATSGTYYVKEITPPSGYYRLSDTENCLRVSVNGSVTFENDKVAESNITVQKRDSFTNFGIDGVKIGLYNDSACANKVDEKTTSNGQVRFTVDFIEGAAPTYYVKEIETPDGYAPESGKIECHAVAFGENAFSPTTIYNKPFGTIKILKRDGATEKPIKGVTFKLLDEKKKPAVDKNGKEVAQATTKADGIIEFKDIFYGTYYIQEVSTNKAYKVIKSPIKIRLNENNDSDKLGKRSAGSYILGDANMDGTLNDDDLVVYQNVISNPDLLLGLAPGVQYALDINGDGNITTTDVQKDLRILEYYLRLAQSEDSSVLTAARNYKAYKNNVCNAIGTSNCDLKNLNVLYSMYTNNKEVAANYATARAAAEAEVAGPNAAAQAAYDAQMAEYNENCGDPDDLDDDDLDDLDDGDDGDDIDDGDNLDDLDDGDDGDDLDDGDDGDDLDEPGEGGDDYDCDNVPTLNLTQPTNVCPNFSSSFKVDVNSDCLINSSDITALTAAISGGTVSINKTYRLGDPNNDGRITHDDKVFIENILSGDVNPSDVQRAACDVTEDGVVDQDDVDIMEIYLGGETSLFEGLAERSLAGSGSIDTSAFAGSADLNGNGTLDSSDVSILTDYVTYANAANATQIFGYANTFITNQEKLCMALNGTSYCTLDDELLTQGLSRVGKYGNLPSELIGVSMVIPNEKIDMKISKQSITNSKEVAGAKIVIKDSNGNVFIQYTSSKSPKKFYIPAGKYTLTETVAPSGYKELKTVVTFQVKSDGNVQLVSAYSNLYRITKSSDSDLDHLIIYNEPYKKKNVYIPDTGSNVAAITIIAGTLLIGGGGYLVYRRYSKQ